MICSYKFTNLKAMILHEVHNSLQVLQHSKSHPRLDDQEAKGTDRF